MGERQCEAGKVWLKSEREQVTKWWGAAESQQTIAQVFRADTESSTVCVKPWHHPVVQRGDPLIADFLGCDSVVGGGHVQDSWAASTAAAVK